MDALSCPPPPSSLADVLRRTVLRGETLCPTGTSASPEQLRSRLPGLCGRGGGGEPEMSLRSSVSTLLSAGDLLRESLPADGDVDTDDDGGDDDDGGGGDDSAAAADSVVAVVSVSGGGGGGMTS